MTIQTVSILDAALKADASVTVAQRSQILTVARNGDGKPEPKNGGDSTPRIFSRKQAAELLGGKTTRYISQLVKRGLLQKFVPRGNVRAIGVTGQSLYAFIAGKE
jgi:hypothetical protein